MKKFLSLVLALVMTMSLVTVSAGAKDFTDDSEITYKEAVDVISALGVVDGYSDGDFRPDDVLTRGAAAKIICNLILGPTTASALSAGTAPFKDVPVTNTFAGYITYCSQQGIISGYADGTFRPTGTLSGNAFMKMLLGALGYDSSIEGYTGANWQVSVIKQASGIGLDDGNDEFVGSQAVTRQEAALYAFNMLQATMVEYDKKDTIVVGDITINTTSTRKDVENNTNTDGNIDGERNGDGLMQFGEKYFKDLEKEDATDIFGHPSSKWVYDGDDVGTYANEADETYVVDDDKMTVEDVLANSNYMNYKVSEIKDAAYFLNGDDDVKSTEKVMKGDVVEAYENDDGDVETVVVARYMAAKIDKVDDDVSTAESRNGASEVLTLTSLDGDIDYGDYYDKYDSAEETLRGYTSAYDEGTVLAVAFLEDNEKSGEVLDSYVAEDITGTVTGYKDDSTVTVDGTKYSFARYNDEKENMNVDGTTKNFKFDEDYTIYLTADGYVIGVEGANAADLSDVYFVTGVYGEESHFSNGKTTHYARAVSLVDGSISDIKLDKDDAGALDKYKDDKGDYKEAAMLCTFDDDVATEWSGGDDYEVVGIDTSKGGLMNRLVSSLDDDLKMDASNFSVTSGSPKKFYVDSNTQYLGIEDAGWATADDMETIYAVGGMKADKGGKAIVIANEDDPRDAVYVILVDAGASIGSTDILYAAGNINEQIGKNEYTGEFWFMDEVTSDEISVDEKQSKGFYKVDSIDEDGIYSLKPNVNTTSGKIDSDSDDVSIEGLELTDTKQIYRNALISDNPLTVDGGSVTLDDVSIANAKIIDGRSNSDRNDSVYDREINSISRLEAALEAATDVSDDVSIDLYVKDGEITFICVTDVGGAAKDDGEQNPEESKYEIAQTSSGTLEITVSGKTLALTNAKVYDSANTENVNYKEMDVSVLVERKSDSQGYVEETSVDGITVRSQGNDKDAQCKIGADNFKVTLPYALSDGDYRVTMTFTGDVVGTITYQDMVTVS